MGKKGIRGMKARVGRKCCTSRARARLNSEGIQAGGSRSVVSRSSCPEF